MTTPNAVSAKPLDCLAQPVARAPLVLEPNDGADGAPFRVTLHRAAGGSRELSGKENLALARGDRIVMETSGGGGYGAPAKE